MDTRIVTGLAGKALEAALGFRANAFKQKAFIDIKSIKTATTSSIRAACKQRGYPGEVPLVNIVDIVGNAVSSAAERWNKVADTKNNVDRDWLRNCVCDLVGGAVIHAAFEETKLLNAELLEREYEGEEEYLDPAGDDYEDMSDDTTNTVIHKPAVTATTKDDDGYYGLQSLHPTKLRDVSENDTTVLPRHEIERDWVALTNGETDPCAWAAVNGSNTSPEPVYCIDAPLRKRSATSTDPKDSDESLAQIVQRKRRRDVERAPAIPVGKAISEDGDEENGREETVFYEPLSQRKVSSKAFWTSAESDRLVATRDSGKSWDEVHESFSNRTKSAIMNKYRTLKDGERLTSRDTAEDGEEGNVTLSQARKPSRGFRL